MNGDWNKHHGIDALRMRYASETVIRWAHKLKRGCSVLDIGCGTGRNSHFLMREGFAVRACDPSSTGRGYTKMGAVIQAEDCLATSLRYHDNSFDAALCFSVFFYLSPDEVALAMKEAARVLKPGGRYLCNLRTTEDGRKTKGVPEIEKDMPLYFYTADQALEMIKGAGLMTEDVGRSTVVMKNRLDDEWIIYGVKP